MQRSFFIIFLILLFYRSAYSHDILLPSGVKHPGIRFGTVYEVTNRFNQSGSLSSLNRLNIAFDSKRISQFSPEFKNLASTLRDIFPHANYSDRVYVGTLDFSGSLNVSYTAPIFAYGVNERWTLGLGLPVANVRSDIHVSQVGANNSAQVEKQLMVDGENVSPELHDAFEQLSRADLVSSFQQTLAEKGYKPLRPVNETILGDVQLVSRYGLWRADYQKTYLENILTLPTGPIQDPDDFLSLPLFHQFNLETGIKHFWSLSPKWDVGWGGSYLWKIEDRIEKRVPKNRDDLLPDKNSKEVLARDLGDVLSTDFEVWHSVSRFLDLGLNYEFSWKQSDHYRGSRGLAYSLLEENTEARWEKFSFIAQFSTIQWFRRGDFDFPFILEYTYSDIVRGFNIDRQLSHELGIRMFF